MEGWHNGRYNPLVLMFRAELNALITRGNVFFVLQSYPRGIMDGVKEALLVTPYEKYEDAAAHYCLLHNDRRRFIYDIGLPDHRERLTKASTQVDPYLVYYPKVKTSYFGVATPILPEVAIYLENHTDWKPRIMTELNITFTVLHGKVLIEMIYQDKTLTVPLARIEEIKRQHGSK